MKYSLKKEATTKKFVKYDLSINHLKSNNI